MNDRRRLELHQGNIKNLFLLQLIIVVSDVPFRFLCYLWLRTRRVTIHDGGAHPPWPCNEAFEKFVRIRSNMENGFKGLQNHPKGRREKSDRPYEKHQNDDPKDRKAGIPHNDH
jgi:hypothetical protein